MSLSRTEVLAHKLLQAVMSFKDAVDQGCIITADTVDLAERAEDALMDLMTHKVCGQHVPVVETRDGISPARAA